MSTDRERDAAFDRLLRQLVRPDEGAAPGLCPAADVLAALVENELPVTERAALDAHVAACDRCQRTVALVGDTPSIQADGTRVSGRSIWRPPLRWLVPALAAATALIVYVAVDLNQRPRSSQAAAPQPAAHTVARSAPAERPASGVAAETNAWPDAAERERSGTRAGGGGGGAMKGRDSIARDQMAQADARKPARAEAPGAAGKPAAVVAPPPVMAESVVVAQPPAVGEAGAAKVAGRGDAAAVPPAAPPPVAAGQAESRKVVAAPPAPAAPTPTRVSALVARAGAKNAAPAAGSVRPTTPTIRSADSTITWRLGPAGAIASSRDGGVTWQPQASGVTSDLLAGSAPVRITCWVVGRAGTVLLTTDGETWQTRPFPERIDLGAVAAQDERRASVISSDGRQFTTTDGGATWVPARQ